MHWLVDKLQTNYVDDMRSLRCGCKLLAELASLESAMSVGQLRQVIKKTEMEVCRLSTVLVSLVVCTAHGVTLAEESVPLQLSLHVWHHVSTYNQVRISNIVVRRLLICAGAQLPTTSSGELGLVRYR